MADLSYRMVNLNGDPAILAVTEQEKPFFALFFYGSGSQVEQVQVIAGQKLAYLRSQLTQAEGGDESEETH